MATEVGSSARLVASWRRAIGAEEAAVQAAFEARAMTPAERNQLQHHLRDERAWLSDFGRKWN
jgi:hypothetical protein